MNDDVPRAIKLYAFWRNDTFPYVLGGKVTNMDDFGNVQVEGYSSYKFKPIRLMPAGAGAELHTKIKAVATAHKAAMARVEKEHRDRVVEILPESAPEA